VISLLLSTIFISCIFSFKGFISYIIFVPFFLYFIFKDPVTWNIVNLISFILFIFYLLYQLIFNTAILEYCLQYIFIYFIIIWIFSNKTLYFTHLDYMVFWIVSIILLVIIICYHFYHFRFINANTCAHFILLITLLNFTKFYRFLKFFNILVIIMSASRASQLVFLICKILVFKRTLICILSLMIISTISMIFISHYFETDGISEFFDLIRYKSGGGSSDYRRIFYYPSLVYNSFIDTNSSFLFGEGPGNRFFQNYFERRSDSLHNAYLIICSDLGLIGFSFFLFLILFNTLKNLDSSKFQKFVIFAFACFYTPIIFGMPGFFILHSYLNNKLLKYK